MKSLRHLSLIAASTLIFAGCASDKPTTSATMPPAGSEATTTTTTQTTTMTTETTEAPVVAPVDTGEMIPISKLPTQRGYPYAIKTKWPGLVKSPYAQDKTLVDVTNLPSNKPARCPHTGKIFIVP
jgi:PBP1b-binding outer membrane lipoprotein LpoB